MITPKEAKAKFLSNIEGEVSEVISAIDESLEQDFGKLLEGEEIEYDLDDICSDDNEFTWYSDNRIPTRDRVTESYSEVGWKLRVETTNKKNCIIFLPDSIGK